MFLLLHDLYINILSLCVRIEYFLKSDLGKNVLTFIVLKHVVLILKLGYTQIVLVTKVLSGYLKIVSFLYFAEFLQQVVSGIFEHSPIFICVFKFQLTDFWIAKV